MKTLRDVKVGETVKVVKLHGEGAVKRRIMDMVAYLFSRDRAPNGYKHRLRTAALSYRLMFNYSLDRYQKDYDRQELWSNFFLRLPDLRHKIERYRIHSLMELEYRAAEYFMDTD